MPGYHLNTMGQAAAVIAAIGADRLGLQFDIYHCQVTEGDITKRMEAHLPIIAHMQLADVPARHEPGTGEIGWDYLFRRIDELGYAGWIGCEYRPAGDTVAGLGWRERFGPAMARRHRQAGKSFRAADPDLPNMAAIKENKT